MLLPATLIANSVLVNNLGFYDAKPIFAITDTEWLCCFETSVMKTHVHAATRLLKIVGACCSTLGGRRDRMAP
jgi:hypothetical protein